MEPAQNDELLTADELAARLHIRPGTVRDWARRGLIPRVRLSPKVIRYSLKAVLAARIAGGEKGGAR